MIFQLLFDAGSSNTLETTRASFDVVPFVVLGGIVFLVGILLFVLKRASSRESSDWGVLNRQKIARQWKEVETLLTHGAPGRKLAVIEADKLLDQVMRGIGFPGEAFAERLKVAEYQHKHLHDVWEPHKWRNRLVHEESFVVGEREAVQALRIYKRALEAFRVL